MASIKKKYKEISTQEVNSRASYALTSDESTKVGTILEKTKRDSRADDYIEVTKID